MSSPPLTLDCLACVFEIIDGVIDEHPDTDAVLLVDRPGIRGGVAIAITGGIPPDVESHLVQLLSAWDREPTPRVVFASIRTGAGPIVPAEDDLEAWRKMQHIARTAAFDLLDWLILADDDTLSMARLTGTWPWGGGRDAVA